MTELTTAQTAAGAQRGMLRRIVVGACLVLAAGLLLGVTWSVFRVGWFTATSDCASTACTGAEMERLWNSGDDILQERHDDLMIAGEQALLESGAADLAIYFGYLPAAVVLSVGLLLVAIMVWGWSPRTWLRHWRNGTAPAAVRVDAVAAFAVFVVVLLYLANWDSMWWMSQVTE